MQNNISVTNKIKGMLSKSIVYFLLVIVFLYYKYISFIFFVCLFVYLAFLLFLLMAFVSLSQNKERLALVSEACQTHGA